MSRSTDLFGAEHVRRYRATDGEEGYRWRNDTTILLLTTTGRKSGKAHTTPLIFRPYADGDDSAYLVVASKGGAPEPPAWLLNLRADPAVTVQIKGDVFAARARTATDQEQAELWPRMVEVWPDYEAYQKRTDRPIPVVVLERG